MGDDQRLARLRDQLEQAKALYQGAKLDYDCAFERMQELGSTHPDGSLGRATRVVTLTLRNYMFALEQYNHFLLDRKPRSLEWLQGERKPPTQI